MGEAHWQKDVAAARGVPSLVWRAGQERRLGMMQHWAQLAGARILVDGCGVGMYVRALRQFTPHVWGLDIEAERVAEAQAAVPDARLQVADGEALPYADDSFDVVLSHEVIEHVGDDRQVLAEMLRVLRPGGRLLLFCPNRLYPFETHGHYWRGRYHFGNTPLINWLPGCWRDRLAPHVRAYTRRDLRRLLAGLPARLVQHTQIYPGFDNIVARWPTLGRWLRRVIYALERTPLRAFGLSHFLVVEKMDEEPRSGQAI
ncbi:MAG: class I SAM-dependent methyltransferase [Anaerolineae bacterium]|nr:class I SAM-dependent methyltransferase [Anaerolineae bacterium]